MRSKHNRNDHSEMNENLSFQEHVDKGGSESDVPFWAS